MTTDSRGEGPKDDDRNDAEKPGGNDDSYVKGRFSVKFASLRSAFFDHKREIPRRETMTPLQQRMETGGA